MMLTTRSVNLNRNDDSPIFFLKIKQNEHYYSSGANVTNYDITFMLGEGSANAPLLSPEYVF